MGPHNNVVGTRHRYDFPLGKLLWVALVFEAGLYICDKAAWLPLSKGVAVLLAVAIAGTAILFVLAFWVASLLLSWRFQFNRRSVLGLLLVVAVPSAWLVTAIHSAEEQRKAVDVLKTLGCQLEHEPYLETDTPWGPSRTLERPAVVLPRSFLVRLLGPDFFADVVYVDNTVGAGSQVHIWTDAEMGYLRQLRQLRELSLDVHGDLVAAVDADDGVSDAGMQHLKHLVELRRLTLGHAPGITDSGLQNVKGMRELRGLTLYGLPRITDAAFGIIGQLPQLRALAIREASIKGTGLEHLSNLQYLSELDLTGNPLSDVAMEHIGRLSQLKALLLTDTGVSDAGFKHLRELRQLQVLMLNGTKVSDGALENLRELKSLRILSLARTRVTDQGLTHLKDLRALEQLDLSGTEVSDGGLKHLHELRNLRTLRLDGTRVTQAGRNQLKALPHFACLELDGPVMWIRFDSEW